MAEQAQGELADVLAAAARALSAVTTIQETLDVIVALAVEVIPGADLAGFSLVAPESIRTPSSNGPIVVELDSLQAELGEGPCLSAIAEQTVCYSPDLSTDARWPRFAPAAAELGMGSLLAEPLFVGDRILGALNLYSRRVDAFDEADMATALLFSTHAAIALSQAQTRAGDVELTRQLREAIESRDVIGQAKGILMERERVDADVAFDMLRRASQRLNIKLRDVAGRVVHARDADDSVAGGAH